MLTQGAYREDLSHSPSDINFIEIYYMLSGFVFG